MNLYYKIIPLIITFVMYAPMTGWAGANPNAPYCEHDPACWEPNDDPSTWYGADCCRPKEDGTEAEVDGVAGRCCGGVWYAKDPAKENSDCWEWDDSNCEYVCSDVPGPEIAADEMETVELECIWSIEPLPTVFATATDYCGNTVAVEQSPQGGGGVYGDGESATITLTAIDECGRSSTLDVVVEFAYECDTTSLQEARAELLRLMRDFIEGCELSDEAIGEIRDLYRRIQEINESFDPPLTQPEAGGHAGGLVGLLLIRLIGEMQSVCAAWQELCNLLSDMNVEIQNTYVDQYLNAYWSTECYSRCFGPLPGPPQFRCASCVYVPYCD